MSQQIGYGFLGSPDIEVSTSNKEIIPIKRENVRHVFYKFSFKSFQDVHVKINGGDPIFLEANEWFTTESEDRYVDSLVIVEADINYRWLGGYKF
ncbi:hypothetical protein [Aquibacillus saliphilus]|uniref:hypothetical protein n=1 Tax=Aquibacillus saliphilus TaxID=1909422 RepID=UPI001CF05FB3|nr:hypothetical protein [Aquibacillus saliphilus]